MINGYDEWVTRYEHGTWSEREEIEAEEQEYARLENMRYDASEMVDKVIHDLKTIKENFWEVIDSDLLETIISDLTDMQEFYDL